MTNQIGAGTIQVSEFLFVPGRVFWNDPSYFKPVIQPVLSQTFTNGDEIHRSIHHAASALELRGS